MEANSKMWRSPPRDGRLQRQQENKRKAVDAVSISSDSEGSEFSSPPSPPSSGNPPRSSAAEIAAPSSNDVARIVVNTGYLSQMSLLHDDLDDDSVGHIGTIPVFTEAVRRHVVDLHKQKKQPKREAPFKQYGLFAGDVGGPDASQKDPRIFYNVGAPSSTFICGSQGSGKSHSLSCLLESCLLSSEANALKKPLTGIVFHYDTFVSDTGGSPCEAAYLSSNPNVEGLYSHLPNVKVGELRLDESDLNTKRMMDLMAVNPQQPGGKKILYLETVTMVLREMRMEEQHKRSGFNYSLFKQKMDEKPLTRDQLGPLKQRLDVLESFMNQAHAKAYTMGSKQQGQMKAKKKKPKVYQNGPPKPFGGAKRASKRLRQRGALESREAFAEPEPTYGPTASVQSVAPGNSFASAQAYGTGNFYGYGKSHDDEQSFDFGRSYGPGRSIGYPQPFDQQSHSASGYLNGPGQFRGTGWTSTFEQPRASQQLGAPENPIDPSHRHSRSAQRTASVPFPTPQPSNPSVQAVPRFKNDSIWTPKCGRLTIVDLSCPMVPADMACSLFNMCLSLFLEQSSNVGRVVALDEAHKYMGNGAESQTLTSSLETAIRIQRHIGARVIISTQEPTISPTLLGLCSVTLVHRFTSPEWLAVLQKHVAGASNWLTTGNCENNANATDKEAMDVATTKQEGSLLVNSTEKYTGVTTLDINKSDGLADLFRKIVALRTGEALLFAPSAAIGVKKRSNNVAGVDDNDEGDGTDVDGAEVVRLGHGVLKVRVRKRVTQDGGRSVMAN